MKALLSLAAVLLLFAGTAEAKSLMVCVLDRTVKENVALPDDMLALPDSVLKCTEGSGKAEDIKSVSFKDLYKKRWELIDVVKTQKEGQPYTVYYLQK